MTNFVIGPYTYLWLIESRISNMLNGPAQPHHRTKFIAKLDDLWPYQIMNRKLDFLVMTGACMLSFLILAHSYQSAERSRMR